jgi:hypothetical protein
VKKKLLILNKIVFLFFSFLLLSFLLPRGRNGTHLPTIVAELKKKKRKRKKKSPLFLSDCADLFSLIANGNVRCWKEGPVGR